MKCYVLGLYPSRPSPTDEEYSSASAERASTSETASSTPSPAPSPQEDQDAEEYEESLILVHPEPLVINALRRLMEIINHPIVDCVYLAGSCLVITYGVRIDFIFCSDNRN